MSDQCHNEILMTIPDEELDNLAKMYRENSDIPYASSVLTNGKRIRKKRAYFIRFMSTRNCWREDVFTLDESGENVYEGLMKTKRLHFGRPLVFYGIPNSVNRTIFRFIDDKKLEVEFDNAYYIYAISKKDAIAFDTDCPDDVEIRKLKTSDAELINSLWQEKFTCSQEYVSSLIEINGGYGVFLKSTDDLVAWTLKREFGEIGMIQTVEAHQRKGYATLAVKTLCQDISKDEEDPTGFVGVSDEASQNLFEKLGFANLGLCNNTHLKAKTN